LGRVPADAWLCECRLLAVDCTWNAWRDWSACNATCGDGVRSRTRDKVAAQNGGADCHGDSVETEVCTNTPCPSQSRLLSYFTLALTRRARYVRFLVPRGRRAPKDDPGCTFGRNLQPGSRFFQSGLNPVDPAASSRTLLTRKALVTFCVSRRRRKMYCGHARLCVCVCLSAAVRPHYCTDPDVTRGRGRGCPLVVHYWADLQSVHRLRCYGNGAMVAFWRHNVNAKC